MKTVLDLDAIEAREALRWSCGNSSLGSHNDNKVLIDEVRRLNRIIHDQGLPDANDFPNQYGGKL